MGLQEDLMKFEQELDRLIREYEKYFLGLEKREPLPLRTSVEGMLRTLLATPNSNTMLKFRLNSLALKLSTYREYWRKTTLLIEEGKYSRDRYKMMLKQEAHASSSDGKETPRREEGGEDDAVRLHRRLVEARRECGLQGDPVSVEALRVVMERKKPEIIAKYGCRDVEFRVVVEGGAPKLKAIPVR